MKRIKRVTIVGVGLIGGSISLALRRCRKSIEIVGVGRRAPSLRKAKQAAALDSTTTDLAKGVQGAQLIVVCTPVNTIVERVREIASHASPGTLITDAGSTKAEIVAALDKNLGPGARFIGSHPLAGDHRAGATHARADLFDGRTVVVTPTRASQASDVQQLCDFWQLLGAKTLKMTARQHDQAVAATSHLPHLVAAALASATPEELDELISTGWLDTTRIAAADPELWTQIFLSNRKCVLGSLKRLETNITRLRTALEREQPAQLESLLKKAKRSRDAVGS